MLGVGGRDLRRAQPLERGDVAGRDDHHAPASTFFAERMLEELAHLAASLTDERDDDDVRCGPSGDRAEQRALAHAGSREETDALALTHRQQAVEDAHARGQRPAHRSPIERARRICVHGNDRACLDGSATVDGSTEPIDDAAEERLGGAHREATAGRLDLVVGTHARQRAERHPDRLAPLEADDLTGERLASTLDRDDVTDANPRHAEAQREARDGENATDRPERGSRRQLRLQRVQAA